MPRIDFSQISAISDFVALPDGTYDCRLGDIQPATTHAGDPMWKLRWIVESGEHAGRIVFDNLIFSPKAMPRVKLICASCGLDVSGEIDLEPAMLLEKRARLTTCVEEFCDEHGAAKTRNRIPFNGYAPVKDHDDLPF